jgi:hypothetical protein
VLADPRAQRVQVAQAPVAGVRRAELGPMEAQRAELVPAAEVLGVQEAVPVPLVEVRAAQQELQVERGRAPVARVV